jgi:hypothetical protein
MQERLSFVATFVVLTATLRIICICLYTGIRQDVPYDIYVYIYIYIYRWVAYGIFIFSVPSISYTVTTVDISFLGSLTNTSIEKL